MFGAGSFFELAQAIREPNDTLSQTLCQLSPIPFFRTARDLVHCNGLAPTYGWANDRVLALILNIRVSNGEVTGLLNTVMYLANKATLDVAVNPGAIGQGDVWDPRASAFVAEDAENLSLLKRGELVARTSAWKIAKCVASIVQLLATTAVPAAKLLRIKKYIKALGGAKESAKLLLGATTRAEKLKDGDEILVNLSAELLGISTVKKNCF